MQVQTRNRFEALYDLLHLNQLELSHEMMGKITEDKLKDRYYELLVESGLHPTPLEISVDHIFKITHQIPILMIVKGENLAQEQLYLFINQGKDKNLLFIYAGGVRKKQRNIKLNQFLTMLHQHQQTMKAYLVEPSLMLQSLRIDEKYKDPKNKLKYPWIRLKRLFQLESVEIRSLVI